MQHGFNLRILQRNKGIKSDLSAGIRLRASAVSAAPLPPPAARSRGADRSPPPAGPARSRNGDVNAPRGARAAPPLLPGPSSFTGLSTGRVAPAGVDGAGAGGGAAAEPPGDAASAEASPGDVTAGEDEAARRTSWVVATRPGLRGGEGESVTRRPWSAPSSAGHRNRSLQGLAFMT